MKLPAASCEVICFTFKIHKTRQAARYSTRCGINGSDVSSKVELTSSLNRLRASSCFWSSLTHLGIRASVGVANILRIGGINRGEWQFDPQRRDNVLRQDGLSPRNSLCA